MHQFSRAHAIIFNWPLLYSCTCTAKGLQLPWTRGVNRLKVLRSLNIVHNTHETKIILVRCLFMFIMCGSLIDFGQFLFLFKGWFRSDSYYILITIQGVGDILDLDAALVSLHIQPNYLKKLMNFQKCRRNQLESLVLLYFSYKFLVATIWFRFLYIWTWT